MPNTPGHLIDELRWRGLVHQITDEVGLRKHLETPGRKIYAGFDPTSDSLTIGNLVPMMMLVHVARHGHVPVAVQGGATGLIGDPSGKQAERTLQTPEMVDARVKAQRPIFERVFANADVPAPTILNNYDWISKLTWIEALRDIGKHFSVNMMIQKDSVKSRLESRDQGISYTEFSYMLMQAYDFAHLHKTFGVTVQMGGSDQWGNIVGGCDLIRRTAFSSIECVENKTIPDGVQPENNTEVFGLTAPLVTKADGTKFGKTESGAIWLSAPSGPEDHSSARTSAFAYYQFWLNALDADVIKYLKIYTLLTQEEIAALDSAHAANPSAREAHRALAHHATAILHGPEAAHQAEAAAKALFSGEIAGLDARTLDEVLAGAPTSTLDKGRLEGAGVPLVDLLVETGLAKSKRESREFLQNGSVLVNGRATGVEAVATTADLLHGSIIALRRGKKNWHVTRWR
ncbi:MAG: tyrosine--tRNA ligase [Phycisphaeraceae bacterium]|nr:tyrosine--tRNA ligase [Phycisphaeraceae bacterium]